ncbi:TlpA family protein disulfide reductase [Deinococcus detaillensis]|uniref:TlpA family protein disulfide reductase n=1 Tax=Deinococcus detaillensis TaxID=2592048 RepID=A0A553ULU3_9DEIO|nr:TlpA disulfide reductase family protein [Deinococcus detaillensis]TSA81155.1 TlpA family protein disulfide reductase [Deinococcus detaillensis]
MFAALFTLLTLPALAVGSAAPPLTLSDSQGHVSRFKPAAKGVTLLNFWATWCPPCREELPRLDAAQRSGKLKVVAVNVGESPAGVLNFWKENQLGGLPLAFAHTADLRGWPLPGLPTSVLLDAGGKVRALKFGPLTAAELEKWRK